MAKNLNRLFLCGLAVVAFSTTALFAACGGKGNCSATNCAGCCDGTGTCQGGNSPSFCGAQGTVCSACPGGTVCQNFVCVSGGSGGGSGGSGGSGGGTGGSGGGVGGGTGGSGGGVGGGTGGSGGSGGGVGGGTGGSGGTGGTGGTGGSGGGTGGTGGTGGAGGGGTLNCLTVATFSDFAREAGYDSVNTAALGIAREINTSGVGADGGPTENYLIQEVYFSPAGNATVGSTYTFTSNDRYNTCSYCVRYYRQCASELISSCSGGQFFSQGGTMHVTTATQSPDAGTFATTLTNLKLVEWTFGTTEGPVTNPRCYIITGETETINWP
jgi:hypothetical protein